MANIQRWLLCDECYSVDKPRWLGGPDPRYEPNLYEIYDADSMCFDCEKYLCYRCVYFHCNCETYTLSKNRENRKDISRKFRLNLVKSVKIDIRDEPEENENIRACNLINVRRMVRAWNSKQYPVDSNNKAIENISNICILRDSDTLLVTDKYSKCIRVFNFKDSIMTRRIKLPYVPCGMVEIPQENPTKSVVAICLPEGKRVIVLELSTGEPVKVSYVIQVKDRCEYVAYCKDVLVILTLDIRVEGRREYLNIFNFPSGRETSAIDLSTLPCITMESVHSTHRIAAHPDGETVYVSQNKPACVVRLSLSGTILNLITFEDTLHSYLCIGEDQSVYMIGLESTKMYKLSGDLSRTTVIQGGRDGKHEMVRDIACREDKIFLAYECYAIVLERNSN